MNDRSAWLAERRRGMGGTDAAGALGVSQWKTELSIYLDKRDEVPPVEKNEAMHWGIVLQNVVRDEYKRRTGATIYNTPLMWSKRYPWMLANTDGRRQDDRRIVEIKTARSGQPVPDSQEPADRGIRADPARLARIAGSAAGGEGGRNRGRAPGRRG